MGDVNASNNVAAELETADEVGTLLTPVEATADWCDKHVHGDTTLYILQDGSCGFLDYSGIGSGSLFDKDSASLMQLADKAVWESDPMRIYASSATGRLIVRMPKKAAVTDGQLEKLNELWSGHRWFSVDIQKSGGWGFATTVLHPNPESFDAVRNAVLDMSRRTRATEGLDDDSNFYVSDDEPWSRISPSKISWGTKTAYNSGIITPLGIYGVADDDTLADFALKARERQPEYDDANIRDAAEWAFYYDESCTAECIVIFADSINDRLVFELPYKKPNSRQIDKMREVLAVLKPNYALLDRNGDGSALLSADGLPRLNYVTANFTFDDLDKAIDYAYGNNAVAESTLLEDDGQQPDFEVADEMQDLFDFYDTNRGDTFNDSNFTFLKGCGNITDTQVFTFDYDSGEKTELLLNDLTREMWSAVDHGRRNLDPWVEGMFAKFYPNGFDITLDYIPCCGEEYSQSFLDSCVAGDVYDCFDSGWSYGSFRELDYCVARIDDKCKRLLRDLGFPSDIYELLAREEADEESPLAEYYDELRGAFCNAAAYAQAQGAADACLADFDDALKRCCPAGTTLVNRDDGGWPTYHVTAEFLEYNIEEFWYAIDRGDPSSDNQGLIWNALCILFTDLFQDGFEDDFREPNYGWEGFDDEQFNDTLYEYLNQLDIEKKSANESLQPMPGDSMEAYDPSDIENSPFFERIDLKDTVPMCHYTIAENGWIYRSAEPDFEYDFETEEVLRFGVQNSLLRIMCKYDGEVDVGLPKKNEGTTREQRDAAVAFINHANQGREYAEVNVFTNKSGFIDTKYEVIKLADPEDVYRVRALM